MPAGALRPSTARALAFPSACICGGTGRAEQFTGKALGPPRPLRRPVRAPARVRPGAGRARPNRARGAHEERGPLCGAPRFSLQMSPAARLSFSPAPCVSWDGSRDGWCDFMKDRRPGARARGGGCNLRGFLRLGGAVSPSDTPSSSLRLALSRRAPAQLLHSHSSSRFSAHSKCLFPSPRLASCIPVEAGGSSCAPAPPPGHPPCPTPRTPEAFLARFHFPTEAGFSCSPCAYARGRTDRPGVFPGGGLSYCRGCHNHKRQLVGLATEKAAIPGDGGLHGSLLDPSLTKGRGPIPDLAPQSCLKGIPRGPASAG